MLSFNDFLLESESIVIQTLIKKFGKSRVFSDSRSVVATDELVQEIFDALNASFFNNSLPKVKILCTNTAGVRKFLSDRDPDVDYSNHLVFGVYSLMYDVFADDVNIDKIANYQFTGDETVKTYGQTIIIDSELTRNSNLIFLVNCVCHEMIHMFDDYHRDYKSLILKMSIRNDRFDAHTTPVFEKKMREARKHKMKIEIDGTGIPFPTLNDNAYAVLTENRRTVKLIQDKDIPTRYHVDLRSIGKIKNVGITDVPYIGTIAEL